MRVSDFIAEFLVSKGVDTVYMLSGGGMMHLIDAVGNCEGLSYVCNHHEQASAMAADGYARKSGRVGVCYLTAGPGGTNAITGVVGAWLDSSPIICLSGQSKHTQTIRGSEIKGLRQYGTFEVDIIPIVETITKYAVFIDDPMTIKYHMEKAYYLSTNGRPGPVWLDIPINIQGAKVDVDLMKGFDPKGEYSDHVFEQEKYELLITKLVAAKRPVILAGHGVKAANKVTEFRELVDKLQIPVLTTPFAVDLMHYDHPLFIGHPSVKGDRPGNITVQNADFILSIGNSFHVMTTGYEVAEFAKDAYIAMIDIDPANFQRQEINIDLELLCDIGNAIDRLNTSACILELAKSSDWIDYCRDLKVNLSVQSEPHKQVKFENGQMGINYYDIIDEMSKLLPSEATLVTDAGSAFYLVGQAFRSSGQFVINSGGLGSMGFALPAAIGAADANKGEMVVCLTGDGSLQTNIQELATIKANRYNIKLIVVNNGGYVSIRNSQNAYFKGNHVGSSKETGVWLPPLDKISDSYSIPFLECHDKLSLESTLSKILEIDGPAILEIYVPHEFEVIPTVASEKLADGSMRSKPLHDMYPYLEGEKLKKYMYHDVK